MLDSLSIFNHFAPITLRNWSGELCLSNIIKFAAINNRHRKARKTVSGFSYIEILLSLSIVSFLSILGLGSISIGERFTNNHLVKQQVIQAKYNTLQHEYIINKHGNVFKNNNLNNHSNLELQCMRGGHSDMVSCMLSKNVSSKKVHIIQNGQDWLLNESYLSASNKNACIEITGRQWHPQSKSCLTLIYTATH